MSSESQHHVLQQNDNLTFIGKLLLAPVNLGKIIWLAFWLMFATVLVSIPILSFSMFRINNRIVFGLVRLWARIILGISGVTVKVAGSEKLQKNQSYIIISNHQSHFDGPALAISLSIQFSWIAKKELLKIPLFGNALKGAGTIFIDRGDRETAMGSIKKGMESLPQGSGIMVFAEGTRSNHGMVGTFKKGGFMAAIQSGLPILPVTIKGSSKALPKGRIIFHPGTIEVIIGDIIHPSAYCIDTIDELTEKTRNTILSNYY